MLHFRSLLQRLLAATALTPLAAGWLLGGCNSSDFDDAACQAALDRCGYLWVDYFCRRFPFECTSEGKPYVDGEVPFEIPPNLTLTVDLSSAHLPDRAIDLRFGACGSWHVSIEDFSIQLDGIDAPVDAVHVDGEEFHRISAHTGPLQKLEITWKGTTGGVLPENPPPKMCVPIGLQDRVCVAKAMNGVCYDPDTE